MRRSFVKVAAVCLSGLLSGCLALGDVDHRATSFDEGVGSFQNRAILLNLARASLKEPMYFISVGSTNGVGTSDFRVSVPSFGEGPNLSATTHAFTFSPGGSTFLDNQTSTNTQMNVFSTHDFYLGLMAPLTLSEIDLLLRQGYPRELVFYLTIAKAKITPLDANFKPDPAKPPYYLYNDPNGGVTNYEEFSGHIELAMEAGLTTDSAVEAKADEDGSADKVIAAAPAASGGKGGVEFVLKADKAAGPRIVECLDEALQSRRGRAFVALLQSKNQAVHLCGKPSTGAQKNVVFWRTGENTYEAQQVEISFRSTYEIFRYLGELMNAAGAPAGQCAAPQAPGAAPLICDYTATDNDPIAIGPLFKVETPSSAGSCFTAITYSNRHYCIPNGGRELDTTKDVFNILVSLLALKQSPGDLPTPQAVVLQ
jgi:hypothetical protein